MIAFMRKPGWLEIVVDTSERRRKSDSHIWYFHRQVINPTVTLYMSLFSLLHYHLLHIISGGMKTQSKGIIVGRDFDGCNYLVSLYWLHINGF